MPSNTGSPPLSSDALAVIARLEHLALAQTGDPVVVGFNALAAACRIDRRRVQEAIHLLTRRGFISKLSPADPNVGRPAAYSVHARRTDIA
jgi:hypothetical protein